MKYILLALCLSALSSCAQLDKGAAMAGVTTADIRGAALHAGSVFAEDLITAREAHAKQP